MKTYTEVSHLAYRHSGIRICYDLCIELKNTCVKMTFNVACHGKNSITKYSYGGVYYLYDVIWNGLCGSNYDYDLYSCGIGTVTLICCVHICPGDGV